MAAPTYTTDLKDWIADNDTTAWTEFTGMIAGGAPDEVDTESALQGINTVSQATNTTSLFSMGRSLASPITLPSGNVFLVWHGHGTATALLSYANGGLRLVVGSSALADWKAYTVGGNDVPPFPYGKWVNNPIDPTLTADFTNGTPPTGGTNIYSVGSAGILSAAVAKGQPHVVDIIRYGRAEAKFLNGDTGSYATFDGFSTVNDYNDATNGYNRWGLLQGTTGGYLWKGLMSLGSGSIAVNFKDTNKNIYVQDTRKVTSSFNKIEVRATGSIVDWTNINILATGTTSRGNFEVVDDATVNMSACSFTDMGTFIFKSNSDILNTNFIRTDQITQNSATLTGCIINANRSTGSIVSNNLNLITDCTFISSGSGHAVIATNTGGGALNWDNNASGYATVSGSTGNETIYFTDSNSSNTYTVNVGSGYTTPTIRTAGAVVNVVSGQVTTTITVTDRLGNPIEGARVYMYTTTGGSLPINTVIFNTLTDVNGEVSDIRSFSTSQPVAGRVRKSTSPPLYSTSPFTATINNATGLELTVLMIDDE